MVRTRQAPHLAGCFCHFPLKWSTPSPPLPSPVPCVQNNFIRFAGRNECPESTLLAWVVTFCFVMVLLLPCFNIFCGRPRPVTRTRASRDLRSDDDDGDDDDAETAEVSSADARGCPLAAACFGSAFGGGAPPRP